MLNYFHIAYSVYFYRALLFGGAGDSKGPLLLLMGSVLLWGYPMYLLRVLIYRLNFVVICTWAYVLCCMQHSFLKILILWIWHCRLVRMRCTPQSPKSECCVKTACSQFCAVRYHEVYPLEIRYQAVFFFVRMRVFIQCIFVMSC
jgi:hypothetical protein